MHETDVADEALVEDRIDRGAIVMPALAQALDPDALGGRPCLSRRRQRLPPQLFDKPTPQERGLLIVIVPGGALFWSKRTARSSVKLST
jgi:hypothetical protein